MPLYPLPKLTHFLALVHATNPTYNKKKSSSLLPLIAVLKNPAAYAAQVVQAITALKARTDPMYGNKANKYKNALHYLMRTYTIAPSHWVGLGAGPKCRALRFTRTALPAVFNPYTVPLNYSAPQVRHAAPNNWEPAAAAESVEDFIYKNPAAVGVVLIHLSAVEPGMDTIFDGMTVTDHMKSVLRAVAHRNGGACALHLTNTAVCGPLVPDYNAVPVRVEVHEHTPKHMGSRHAAFNTFIGNYQTIIVMGWDANICARANLFGTFEWPDGAMPGTNSLPPLVSQANVVTSRALLVTLGVIDSMPQYGQLQNL